MKFVQNFLDSISGKKRYNNIVSILNLQAKKIEENSVQIRNLIENITNLKQEINDKFIRINSEQIRLYRNSIINMLAPNLHSNVFPKYRNCNKGKEIVILASGPTLDYYKKQKDKLYLGVNRAFMANKADLDYLFVQDYASDMQDAIDNYKGNNCQKFYGIHYCAPSINQAHADLAKAERYYFIDCDWNALWSYPHDISIQPFNTYSSVVHPAVTFALWTGVSKIYLVGCDTSQNGSASDAQPKDGKPRHLYVENIKRGWEKMKDYAKEFYPETEIISINPVGLKGLFKDVYTESYLSDHPELKNENIEILKEGD